jgi:sensor histidine kinase regulating citrate/malate metabolism
MLVHKSQTANYLENIEGVDLGVNLDDTAYFVDALITGLYSNPLKACVQELTSNSFDSSVNTNPDAPINLSVYYDSDLGKSVFEVQDFGCSMTKKEVYEIYNSLGSSTAKGDALKIGAFGKLMPR